MMDVNRKQRLLPTMMEVNRNRCCCYGDVGEQETDAVATMMDVNRKQMQLLYYDDGFEQETDAVATMMDLNRKQMLLLR